MKKKFIVVSVVVLSFYSLANSNFVVAVSNTNKDVNEAPVEFLHKDEENDEIDNLQEDSKDDDTDDGEELDLNSTEDNKESTITKAETQAVSKTLSIEALDILALQRNLKTLGFFVNNELTGKMDAVTTEEIKAFQKYYSISVTGKADTTTLNKIDSVLNSPLRNGQRHADAIPLKENLSRLGFHISNNPTTLYGASTAETVKHFQRYYGLRINGIADEVTLNKITEILNSPFRNGQRHEKTIQLKIDLEKLGYGVSSNPTTLYGALTEASVREFQRDNNLIVNGIADEVTLSLLEELLNIPLQNGMYREDAVQLKINLSTIGFHVSNNPTPLFGPSTERVVKEFQTYYGLTVNGKADNATLDKINQILASPLREGQRHESAIKLKEDLSFLGFHVSDTPTTLYGSSTARKVAEFQEYHGLRVNGIADEVTLSKIEQLLTAPLQDGLYRMDVVSLKQNLAEVGFTVPGNNTPLYGPLTSGKVREFQSYYGLQVTGIANQATLDKLNDILNSPFRNGGTHQDVITLKENLSIIGFHISDTPTSLYGIATERNVRDLQQYYGLVVNGIADEVTLAKIQEVLGSPLRNGERHESAIKLKEDLSILGFHISDNPTTLYGQSTERMVIEFQTYYGLVPNGIGDERTLRKIEELLDTPLQEGRSDNRAIAFKEDLARLGFIISNNPTALYGTQTANMVRAFQEYYGLRVNGMGDEVTLRKVAEILNSPFQNGRSHNDTIKLKQDLSRLGFHISDNPTRLYGTSTERMVRDFQTQHGLRVSGIADEVTLAKIAELIASQFRVTYTQYNLTLNEAIAIQNGLNPPPQTDKYRNAPAFIHSSLVDLVERGVTNTSGVRLRTSPHLLGDSNVYGTVSQGTTFTIVRQVRGDMTGGSDQWYEIRYNSQTLFVHSPLVNISTAAIIKANGSSVRESASGNSHLFGTARKDETYAVARQVAGTSVSGSTTWLEISYNTWRNAKTEDFRPFIDPSQNNQFQHLVLNSASGISAMQLNNVLAGRGVLSGLGNAFIEAGKRHSINEIYLISHALLETGNGSSKLATGIEVGKNSRGDLILVTDSNRNGLTDIRMTHNMFGYGAFDSDPYGGGARFAYQQGWFTPEAAIIGGAGLISNSYFNRGQNTLYKMRWNHAYQSSPGFFPQYATDMEWATKQVTRISQLYDQLDNPPLHFDIVQYK